VNTCWGLVCDELGHARSGGRAWATPSLEVRSVQATRIGVDQHHDHREIGQVIHLERGRGGLWAVAEIDDTVKASVSVRVAGELVDVPHDLFWSPERRGAGELGGIVFDWLSVTPWPARVAPRPLVFREGDAHLAASRSTDPFERDLLKRASEAKLTRHGHPIVVHDQTPRPALTPYGLDTRATPPIEIRSAPEPVDVSISERLIELIVMPYETPALVHHKGRMIEEICSVGAFDGIERQTNRVRVNRDHERQRTVGRAVRFYPRDPQGLLAHVRIARTPLGDETLALASDGCLDASAGFGVEPDGERWEARDRRRLTRLFLDHIALTPDPAYVDANVLAVRGSLAAR